MASHDLASISEGNFYEEEKSSAPPLFEGRNYKGWKSLMEIFIKKLDINAWDIAIARPADESNKQERHLNAKAMHYIFCALSQDIFKVIYCFSSAYKVWKFLEEMYDFPLTGIEQTQELENIQACTNSQESLSHDKSMKCTSTERDEEVLSSEEECQKDFNETMCSSRASPKSNVKKSNPIFCTSISSLQILQTTNRKIKKLKEANKYLRIENKNLKAKLNEESNSILSSSTHSSLIENIIPCVESNDIKEQLKELEKEIIFIKEQNEKLCLENSSLINDCAKCKEYKIEIKEMDETFDEYRDEYEKHIESIATTLKNSTIAYNKARHDLKTKNDELETKIILLKKILKKNSQSKLNTNFHNISKPNKGNKNYQMFKNEIPNHHHSQNNHSPNVNLKINKFPIKNILQNYHGNLTNKNNINPIFEWRPKIKNETLNARIHSSLFKPNNKQQKMVNELSKHYHHHHLKYQPISNLSLNANKFPINNVLQNHNGNLMNKNNCKPRYEWRSIHKNDALMSNERVHSFLSPQKKTRCIWVPKGTVTPGPFWIPKSLIH